MSVILHVVDAFTDVPFRGNPAAVCVLDRPYDPEWMQLVAREMNLSETAFLHEIEGGWSLRWFTPSVEISLCGHATLASAFLLWETGRLQPTEEAHFLTFSGWLVCRRLGDWIEMDFPSQLPVPSEYSEVLADALGCPLEEVRQSKLDYLVEVANEKILRGLQPNFSLLRTLPVRGIIVTSRSETAEFDFVSRFFAPASGIYEDPVTGSAHCTLGPYWQSKLGKNELIAYQASQRGGVVKMKMQNDRVLLQGQAVLMSRVELFSDESV